MTISTYRTLLICQTVRGGGKERTQKKKEKGKIREMCQEFLDPQKKKTPKKKKTKKKKKKASRPWHSKSVHIKSVILERLNKKGKRTERGRKVWRRGKKGDYITAANAILEHFRLGKHPPPISRRNGMGKRRKKHVSKRKKGGGGTRFTVHSDPFYCDRLLREDERAVGGKGKKKKKRENKRQEMLTITLIPHSWGGGQPWSI